MDPIANMLTSIRNAGAAGLPSVTIPASKVKLAMLNILRKEGYISDVKLEEGVKPVIVVTLRYNNKRPAISHIRRVSKPGLRIYRQRTELPRPLRGMGLALISTPDGVLTDKEARKKGVGGEFLCEVW